jgi:lipopolysaccharide/colanic/teichoic acid biosynthesis glycosyltransferase
VRRPRTDRATGSPAGLESIPEGIDREAYTPPGAYAHWGKRLLNACLLSLSLPVALLLALPIALLNWLSFGDPRRILYCQPRVGRRGRVFWIWKFRTMREADDAFDSWRDGHDRARVTRFGRLLRNTHLDELPQLLNILRGEMDFIGPRPEMIEIDRWACERIAGFRLRNALLPGITGFAQITQGYAGMDERAYAEKLAADRLYCRKVSLGFDLEILARTALWMLRGRGWRWQEKKCPRPTVGEPLQAESANTVP